MLFVSSTMQKYKNKPNCQRKNSSLLQDGTNYKGIVTYRNIYITKKLYLCSQNYINKKPTHYHGI